MKITLTKDNIVNYLNKQIEQQTNVVTGIEDCFCGSYELRYIIEQREYVWFICAITSDKKPDIGFSIGKQQVIDYVKQITGANND